MTEQPRDIAAELRPYVDRSDADAVNETADRLVRSRPVPRAGFRAELRTQLLERERQSPRAWRPKNLKAAIFAYAASGLALLAVAALGTTGSGPLGY